MAQTITISFVTKDDYDQEPFQSEFLHGIQEYITEFDPTVDEDGIFLDCKPYSKSSGPLAETPVSDDKDSEIDL